MWTLIKKLAIGTGLVTLTGLVVLNEAQAQGVIENPTSLASGVGVISGWHCDANEITVAVDGGAPFVAAYGTDRADTMGVCGDSNNGFGLLVGYGIFGPGDHEIVAYADGVQFDEASFAVTTYGDGFLRGQSGSYVAYGFPGRHDELILTWSQAAQNFIADGYGPENLPLAGKYYLHEATVSVGDQRFVFSEALDVAGSLTLTEDGQYTQVLVVDGRSSRRTGTVRDVGASLVFDSNDGGGFSRTPILDRGNVLSLMLDTGTTIEVHRWVVDHGATPRSMARGVPVDVDCAFLSVACMEGL